MLSTWQPSLARHVRLRHDPVRDADLLLLPERVVVLRGSAAEILRLCDGKHTIEAIVAELAHGHPNAPVDHEVPAFLERVHIQGWLT
ncbi:pyrroloquinoline quinone biosynthesis protein D [Actinacidiphila yanglinensis]|uniref:Pyrroloquinoline quinone biosynthesis protein D n=1 Tax=Actinacidiphila yanglinensis TaxID=310779 RepID=A0A1H6DD33_9ACTN|nr:pyrroloquinoline quinone biosynthesis peptide chaperone PqqD [Actinacidiphila yanglinensis]SEG82713.1 pyrroloquinoline quinone biosynthesis protein D [Actinacidiphila yanglinensis]